jgi:hypothetical protein
MEILRLKGITKAQGGDGKVFLEGSLRRLKKRIGRMYDEFKGKWVVRVRGGRTGLGSCPVAGCGMSGVGPGLLLP